VPPHRTTRAAAGSARCGTSSPPSPRAGLPDAVARDPQGFVYTGDDVPDPPGGRPPHALETSVPRLLAVGDVRHGSVKRVASAVGEGSVAVQTIHRLLAAA